MRQSSSNDSDSNGYDYRVSLAYFLAGVHLVVKFNLVKIKAVIGLATFALLVSGCSDAGGPAFVAWLLVLVLLALALGIFYLINRK